MTEAYWSKIYRGQHSKSRTNCNHDFVMYWMVMLEKHQVPYKH